MRSKIRGGPKKGHRDREQAPPEHGSWRDALRTHPWRLYRRFKPVDLYSLGNLRKALRREFDHIESRDPEVLKAEEADEQAFSAKKTLTHILHCWYANVMGCWISAGPMYQIHFLKGQYAKEEELSLNCLQGSDALLCKILLECLTEAKCFQLFLARFTRVAYGSPIPDTNYVSFDRAEDKLGEVIHAGGRRIKTTPRVHPEEDLLNPWYFEVELAGDNVTVEGEVQKHTWERTVLILVPYEFEDEFFGRIQQRWDDNPEVKASLAKTREEMLRQVTDEQEIGEEEILCPTTDKQGGENIDSFASGQDFIAFERPEQL